MTTLEAAPEARVRLRLDEVSKSFVLGGRTVEVLRGVTFALAAGEALAVTGPSGSGKSTLLHLIGTLDRPTGGTITVDGVDPGTLAEPELARFRNRTVGFVFQEHHLLPQYSVVENVVLPALAFPRQRWDEEGPPRNQPVERAAELLRRVGLGHRLDHRPAELSGGERQRAAVARALVNRPSLLLCDEPTGSLDRATAGEVADLLFELHGADGEGDGGDGTAPGRVMIVVTHSHELAARFARRCELVEGRCSAA